jgi:hypothetical protein
MLRVVFEHPHAFPHYSPHTELTDVMLEHLVGCKKLKVLALSKTSGMTDQGFIAVLKQCPIETLDFHWYPYVM